jgi:hypothetical protein
MEINKYDIVISKPVIRHLRGRMNTYNKTAESKEFYGYGIVTGVSKSYVGVYLPNKAVKIFRKINLKVVYKYMQA